MTEPGNEEQHDDDSQTAAEDAEEKRINDPLTRTEVMGPRVPFGSPAATRKAVDQLRVRERRKREASRWVLLSGGACQGVLSFAKPRQAVCGQCYLVDHGDVGGVFYGDLSMCVLVCASYLPRDWVICLSQGRRHRGCVCRREISSKAGWRHSGLAV